MSKKASKSKAKSAAARKPAASRKTFPAMSHREGTKAARAHTFVQSAAGKKLSRGDAIERMRKDFKLKPSTAAHWHHQFSRHPIAKGSTTTSAKGGSAK